MATAHDVFEIISNGDRLNEGYFNGIYTGLQDGIASSLTQSGLNTIRTLIDRAITYSAGQIDGWGEAYIDADGRSNSVDTNSTLAIFDTNKYKFVDYSTEPHVLIYATSLTESKFSINNCVCEKYDTGKWILRCTTGTANVKRSQIMKTLFYGTNGTDYKVTGITGLTALKTSDSKDIGKRAIYITTSAGCINSVGSYGRATETFDNTTTNTNCTFWYSAAWNLAGDARFNFNFFGTGIVNVVGGISSSSSIGSSSSTSQNPTSLYNDVNSGPGNSGSATNQILILCVDGITLGTPQTEVSGSFSHTKKDFYVDHSIPLFTDSSAVLPSNLIIHAIPTGTFPSTISNVIGVPMIADWEAGADIKYKLTNATEDSGWLDYASISNFTAFTSEPTKLIVKLIPKSTSPTAGYPSIKGFWIRAY